MTTSARSVMATSDSAPILVDTSVAVPLVLEDHDNHVKTRAALANRELGLAGHAGFETFSVLTRLPPPNRRTPAAVGRLLTASFPHSKFLGTDAAASLLERLPEYGVSGGSIYDALVGAAAAQHGLALATRDRRALETYRALEVQVEMLA